ILCAFSLACAMLGAGAAPPTGGTVTADTTRCAGVVAGSPQTGPTAGKPCWVDVLPYPFGADGNPVAKGCGVDNIGQCLPVKSFAFRAWNRGLAATAPITSADKATYSVWLYNGTRWFPDPTFPGAKTCPGTTVLWAGKLDYWLIGRSEASSATSVELCRFDGV